MWQTGEDVEHLGRQLSCPVILYRPVQTLYHFPGGREVPGTNDLCWCGRTGSLTG
jgi:hypothetical protein